MNKFTTMLERSKAIAHFAEVERMSQNDIYEFFYECYCSYADLFMERIRHGGELKRILSEYRHIPEFMALKPSQLRPVVFNSRKMAYWFAFMFWQAIDRQMINGAVSRYDLQTQLTFSGPIPSAKIMEEIIYEEKQKINRNQQLPERPVGETQGKANRIKSELGCKTQSRTG